MTSSPSLKLTTQSLYDTDYVQWMETTLQKLRQKDYANVDWENLLDEIEYMSRKERQSLRSHLIVLLMHLLKWQYQPERRSGSWAGSIVEHRRRINEQLIDSPSLRPYLEEIFATVYSKALKQAAAETMLPASEFPAECPYSITAALDDDFLPS